jgi:glycosyltransferase involved in cell wall biosynthesis
MLTTGNETPIKVCHLLDFYPPFVGGLEQHSYEIEELLSKKNVETFVLSRKIDSSSKSFEHWGSIAVRRISPKGQLRGKGWKALFPILLLVIKIFFLLIRYKNRYDIILVSSLKVLSIPAIIAKSILNKKCIIMVVSPDELGQDVFTDESLKKMGISRSSIFVKTIRTIRNNLINRTDAFMILSSELKQQLSLLKVEPEKIYTIPNGIDTIKFSPVSMEQKIKLRKKLSIPENKIIFCYAGRIARAKGIMNLIEVWNEIRKKFNGIYLVFAGSGEGSYDYCKDELLQFISDNHLINDVMVTGYVEQINEYMQAADIFVFPSDYEGFGLVILEGLACGLPAVLTKVGAAQEVVNNYENGIVIPPKNKDELYKGVEWVLQHKAEWDSLGKNARKSVEKYSMDIEANKYYDLFKELHQKG